MLAVKSGRRIVGKTSTESRERPYGSMRPRNVQGDMQHKTNSSGRVEAFFWLDGTVTGPFSVFFHCPFFSPFTRFSFGHIPVPTQL